MGGGSTSDIGSAGEPPAPPAQAVYLSPRCSTRHPEVGPRSGTHRVAFQLQRTRPAAEEGMFSALTRWRSAGAPPANVAGAARARSKIGLVRCPRTLGIRPVRRRSRRGRERMPQPERLQGSACSGPRWHATVTPRDTQHGMNESQRHADYSTRCRTQKNTEFGKHAHANGLADEH